MLDLEATYDKFPIDFKGFVVRERRRPEVIALSDTVVSTGIELEES